VTTDPGGGRDVHDGGHGKEQGKAMPVASRQIPAARRTLRLLLAVTVVAGLSALGVLADPALVAAGTPGWSPTPTPIPANAGADPFVFESGISCDSTTSCIAVGQYSDTNGYSYHHGLIDTLSGGAWRAVDAPLPANAGNDSDGLENALLYQASCGSTTSCVAVGTYRDTDGHHAGVIDTLSGGTWTAIQAPQPADAGTDGDGHANSYLNDVVCTSPSSCVAVGAYTDNQGFTFGLIDTLAGGTWTATAAPEPPDAGSGSEQAGNLSAVACPSAGTCMVVGGYVDTNGFLAGMVDSEAGGTWSATGLPEPANAGTDGDFHQYASVGHLDCVSGADCVAAGVYDDTSGFRYGLIDTLSGGAWTTVQAPQPADSGTDGDGKQLVQLAAVGCSDTVDCAVAGEYEDASGYDQGLLEVLSAGVWTATEAPVPPGAGTDGDGQQSVVLNGVTCPLTTSCTAAGAYRDSSGFSHGLFEVSAGTTWTPVPGPEPAGGGTDGDGDQDAAFQAIACAMTTCFAAGGYETNAGDAEGLLASVAGLYVTTSFLPGASPGVAYSTQLEATGGPAPYRWHRVSGTLPKGMKLQREGLLTGTPSVRQAPGLFTFTVEVKTTKVRGVPVASATQTLTLSTQS